MALLLLLEQSNTANAVIMHSTVANSNVDTNKPLAPQFNLILQYQITHMSTMQYRNLTHGVGRFIENATNFCNSPIIMTFPQALKPCNFYMPFIYVICQGYIANRTIFECSNPSLSDYIVNHGMRNPEANVIYNFEIQQRTTGNASDIFSRDKSVIFR